MGKKVVDALIGAMLLLAVYFALFGGEYTLFELREMRALETDQAAALEATEVEIAELRRLTHELRTDPLAIERVARERYGMIRDGEILYRFRDPAPVDEPGER